ncbi:ABC transporter permease [Gordonibacter sp.]|uniref:ABC transporter permease n=1 Tax=Gordonibacter sp. TaxID=1968902 RepID=UPI0025BBF979|nr:ABC transporter permease [Gordonibacter sp.]
MKLGLAGRLFGIPGFVAHRNLSRSTARGRTVVTSLAVSTVLIVTTGSLAVAMDPIMERAQSSGGAGSGADVIVSAHIDYSSASNDAMLSDHVEDLDHFLADARTLDGVEFLGSARQGQTEVVIPGDMITTEAREVRESLDTEQMPSYYPRSFGKNGTYYGDATLFYVDDASWRKLVNELGQDESAFADPAHLRALGLNTFNNVMSDGTYVSTKPFANVGAVSLYTIQDREGFLSIGMSEGDDGLPAVAFINTQADTDYDIKMLPASEVATSIALEVAALTEDEPAVLNTMAASSRFPAFILPESAAAGGSESPLTYGNASFSFKADDHAKAAEALEALGATYSGVTFNVADITESSRQNRLMMQAMQLFVLCFSVITALIAVANVFNTLANSIILRTREFAVLRSTGMGNRAFARMLAYECASYAVRGLVIGLVIAIAVAYALYLATTQSFMGLAFTLPWPYLGAAVAVVLVVLALSVAYALHRARAGSIVEALRTDAI